MLKIVGKKEILNNEVLVIEGGFGEGKKIVTAKTIADIHNMEVKEVTKSIRRLIINGRLKHLVDYMDVKPQVNTLPMNIEEVFGVKPAYLSRVENIFILSERGYSKLIKSMDDDTSWDVHDKMIDEYFTMRSIINSIDNQKNKLLLDLFSTDPMIVDSAHKQLVALETAPLQQEIVELKPLAERYNIFLDIDGLTDIDSFSKQLAISGLGRNAMYSYMRDQKFLQSGAKQNVPYAQYVNGKTQLFKVKNTGFRIDRSGNRIPTTKTYLTAKGVDYFLKRFTNEGLIN